MATEPRPDVLLSAPPRGRESAAAVFDWILGRWWVTFTASMILVVSGHLLIKAGLNSLAPQPAATGFAIRILREVFSPQVLAGLFIYLMGTVCWMLVVSQKEISFLYPLSSVNYVLVAAASTMFFHEVISARRAAGVFFVVLGMILMNQQSGRRET